MNKAKKILHIQLLPLLSGVQRVTLNEINEVNTDYPNKYAYYVVCNGVGPLTDELEKIKIPFSLIPELKRNISPFNDIKSLFKMIRFIKNEEFDIVHTHSSKTGLIGRLAAKISGVKKVVHTVHGFSFPAADNLISKIVFYFMEWFAKFFTDELFVLNKTDYELAIKKLKYNKDKVHIIPNGINIDRFRPQQKTHDGFRVVMVGRLWEQKNPMCLVYAAEMLLKKYSDINIDFIGDGDLRDTMQNYLNKNNLSNNIKILGWINDVDKLLPKYDLFVLPSLWEGMPLAILEAQSCGLPAVVSDIPGNSDLIHNNLNGFVFAKNDASDLSSKIEMIYLSVDLKKEMSLKARDIVCDKYSSLIRNDAIIHHYEN
ncbi:glycosyltransferase family 4 protein [Aliivibrio fischeri]|uniref:glycosyltransferase family 4 protein n=1 Tax=Aliivibrio fischeri TaxID=668 RepID=UPI0007C4C1F6|nr:glycosyltransferase family 4 protein [Aliivibrio fischeri]